MSSGLDVLVVCKGNLCRSPMAAAVLRCYLATAGLPARVASAGSSPWHEGDPAEPLALEVLTRRGYRLIGHRARRVDRLDFALPRLIFAVDGSVHAALQRLAPPDHAAEILPLHPSLDIPDPYYDGVEAFEHALDLIEDAVELRRPMLEFRARAACAGGFSAETPRVGA